MDHKKEWTGYDGLGRCQDCSDTVAACHGCVAVALSISAGVTLVLQQPDAGEALIVLLIVLLIVCLVLACCYVCYKSCQADERQGPR